MASQTFTFREGALTARELSTYPLISLSKDSALFQLADQWFGQNGVRPSWVSLCSNMTVVSSLIRSGLGVGLMPTGSVGAQMGHTCLTKIETASTDFLLPFFTIYDPHASSAILGNIAAMTRDVSDFANK